MQGFKIAEILSTIQGEGWWVGMPVTLLRLQGCNLHCPFCDTKYSIDPKGGKLVSLGQLFGALEKFHPKGRTILLTGGEPTIQPLEFLVPPLRAYGPVHLETNGTNPLDKGLLYAWVTVSPKPPNKVHPTALGRADEIKWLVSSEDDIAVLCSFLKKHQSKWMDYKRICVQPISQDRKATTIAIAACMEHGWRLSLQMHKYLEVP